MTTTTPARLLLLTLALGSLGRPAPAGDLAPGPVDGPVVLPLPGLALREDRPAVPDPARPAPDPLVPPAGGRAPLKVAQTADGFWGSLTSKVEVLDRTPALAGEDPLARRAWQTDEAWRFPLPGPFFVFGQLGARSDEPAQSDLKVSGRTGLACKLPLGAGAEVQVRGGPGVTYTDPLRPERAREHADWTLEVQARWPLLARLGLEYQGTAAPALSPLEQDRINQDLHLGLQVGEASKVQVGARHRWQNTDEPQPWSQGMQLYLGLELAH
jgi:hypothetical protein